MGDLTTVRRIVSYSVLSHLATGVALFPVAWLVAHWVIPASSVPESNQGLAETVFLLAFGVFVLGFTVRPFGSLLVGMEQMWITSVISQIGQLANVAVVVVSLSLGAGLYGLVGAAFVETLVQGGASYVAARRLLGGVFANPFRLDRAILKRMLRFAGWTQAVTFSRLVDRQAAPLFIGAWVSTATVGAYDVASRLAQQLRGAPLTLPGPLVPAAAGLHVRGDTRALHRMLLQGNRLVAFLTIGLAGYIVATAPLIIVVWLGKTYAEVVTIARSSA